MLLFFHIKIMILLFNSLPITHETCKLWYNTLYTIN